MEGALIEDDQSDDDAQKTICCGACTEDAEEELGCVAGPLLLSVLIVVCGTASTITSKLQYEVRSRGFEHCHYDDRITRRCPFTKPYLRAMRECEKMRAMGSRRLTTILASGWAALSAAGADGDQR